MRDGIRLHDGQIGALVAIGGEVQVLDFVSGPDAFAILHGPLVQGYALDALEQAETDAPTEAPPSPRPLAASPCWSATARPTSARPAPASARSFASPPTASPARALAHDGELIQLTAFLAESEHGRTASARSRPTRVRRPSRRR